MLGDPKLLTTTVEIASISQNALCRVCNLRIPDTKLSKQLE